MSSTRPSRSHAPAEVPQTPVERSTVLRAQLRCYLCAETCGAIESPPHKAIPPTVRFSSSDGAPARLVAWRGLRCPRCGSGSLFVDEPETLHRRVERVNWDLDKPRRGRPPHWLIAQRSGQGSA